MNPRAAPDRYTRARFGSFPGGPWATCLLGLYMLLGDLNHATSFSALGGILGRAGRLFVG